MYSGEVKERRQSRTIINHQRVENGQDQLINHYNMLSLYGSLIAVSFVMLHQHGDTNKPE